jgi:hypothetical protein
VASTTKSANLPLDSAGLAIKGGVVGLAFGAAVGGMFYIAYKTDEKNE